MLEPSTREAYEARIRARLEEQMKLDEELVPQPVQIDQQQEGEQFETEAAASDVSAASPVLSEASA